MVDSRSDAPTDAPELPGSSAFGFASSTTKASRGTSSAARKFAMLSSGAKLPCVRVSRGGHEAERCSPAMHTAMRSLVGHAIDINLGARRTFL